jgi:diguanylate cyclase (GGDEF)-like protein
MGCVTLEVTSIREINARYGHDVGDAMIQKFSAILLDAAGDVECFIGRNGGNKFLAIFRDCTDRKLRDFLNEVRMRVQIHNEASNKGEIRYCYGEAFNEGEDIRTVTALIALSDRRAFEKEML